MEAGFTKDGVRTCSRQLQLRTWDKPAAACLASRVPYGTPVTVGTLRSVADAESRLRSLGFRQLRVRHYGDTARIEVPGEDLSTVVARRHTVTAAVHTAGYRYVTLDLDGFRSGNLNDALVPDTPARPGGRMIGVRVKLTFPEELVREPIIARMVQELGVVPNIRRADVGEDMPDGSSASSTGKERRSTAPSSGSGASGSRSTCSATSSRADPSLLKAGRRSGLAGGQVSSGVRMVHPAPDTFRGS